MNYIRRDLLIEWLETLGYELQLDNMEWLTFTHSTKADFYFSNDFSNCLYEVTIMQKCLLCRLNYTDFLRSYNNDVYCV